MKRNFTYWLIYRIIFSLMILNMVWTVKAEPVSPPKVVVVHLEGMTCGGCEKGVESAVREVDFVKTVKASFVDGSFCVTLDAEGESDVLRAALEATPYRVTRIEVRDVCSPPGSQRMRKDPWGEIDGIDARVVSRGEKVKLKEVLEPGKFTLIDFGAPWCGPCYVTADALKAYLADHSDTAVRVISLDADDPSASFALPVAKQHLKWAPGLPYLLVYDQNGKEIYKGQELDKALKMIASRREK